MRNSRILRPTRSLMIFFMMLLSTSVSWAVPITPVKAATAMAEMKPIAHTVKPDCSPENLYLEDIQSLNYGIDEVRSLARVRKGYNCGVVKLRFVAAPEYISRIAAFPSMQTSSQCTNPADSIVECVISRSDYTGELVFWGNSITKTLLPKGRFPVGIYEAFSAGGSKVGIWYMTNDH